MIVNICTYLLTFVHLCYKAAGIAAYCAVDVGGQKSILNYHELEVIAVDTCTQFWFGNGDQSLYQRAHKFFDSESEVKPKGNKNGHIGTVPHARCSMNCGIGLHA
eukprot:2046571-Amphidinium_carterae.1